MGPEQLSSMRELLASMIKEFTSHFMERLEVVESGMEEMQEALSLAHTSSMEIR